MQDILTSGIVVGDNGEEDLSVEHDESEEFCSKYLLVLIVTEKSCYHHKVIHQLIPIPKVNTASCFAMDT